MGNEIRTVKIKTTDGQSMSVSAISLPITLIYKCGNLEREFTVKESKKKKGLFLQ